MKTILFKGGKFFGYEHPEEPKYGRLDKYHAKCDEARANALEIENTDLLGLFCKFIDNKKYYFYEQSMSSSVKDSDTFPLPDTLEWEIVYQLLTMNGWEDTIEANYKLDVEISTWKTARQVLRLKEKAVVNDDRPEWLKVAEALDYPKKKDIIYEFPYPRGSKDWRDVVTAFIMRVGNYMLNHKHSEHYPLWGKQLKQHVEELRAWYAEIPVPNESSGIVAIGGIEERGETAT